MQALNVIFERARPVFVLERGIPLENLKVGGNFVEGPPRLRHGATWPPWSAHNSRLGVELPQS